MARVMESMQLLNSLVRTTLALVVVGGVGWGSWFGYNLFHKSEIEAREKDQRIADAEGLLKQKDEELARRDERLREKEELIIAQVRQLDDLGQELEAKKQEIAKLEAAKRLLKLDRRLARLNVKAKGIDGAGDAFSDVEFVELDEQGAPLDVPREFRLKGDVVYLDYWVVKFDDDYVEQADLLRGASICLFRRIFSEARSPNDGFVLDRPNERPTAFADAEPPNEFEQAIWGDFWKIANQPEEAERLGIRAAHGEAVSIKVEEGKSYLLQLRASDGLSIVPEEAAPPPRPESNAPPAPAAAPAPAPAPPAG